MPTMPDIDISTSGIFKLLTSINPSKAAGPDATKHVKTWLKIFRPKNGWCTTLCAIQNNTRSSSRFITPIFPAAYKNDTSHPPPRIAPKSYPGIFFINTHSTPWLLCNGTDYLLTLFYCLDWLSSVRQFGVLTTSYHKHNSSVFNLILTLILLIVLTLSSTFHLTIALYILTTHLLLFLTAHSHPCPLSSRWRVAV